MAKILLSGEELILEYERNGFCKWHMFINTFTTQSQLLTTLKNKPFRNIVGKGENAGYQHFLLFQQCFLPFPKQNSGHIYFVVCKFFQFGPA